ncbi:MAG: hypothetical protein PHZ14_08815 [Sulfuricella sp.]|jgi:hypothetical protein|nr:hypothetical protein [Sulfuricella sp.]
MQRITVDGHYPVWVEEIAKADTPWHDVDEVAAALSAGIRHQAGVALIGVFDHYGLNLRVGASLPLDMQDAKMVLFCPGARLLRPEGVALCPRAIGVADMGNRFVISFLEAATAASTETLALWVEELRATHIA